MNNRNAPIHTPRPSANAGANKRRKPKQAPAREYEPGYFTALIRARNWPPRWSPAPMRDMRNEKHLDAAREIAIAQRAGWHSQGGTIAMAGTPKWRPPGSIEGGSK